jgi:hypothetical protein
LAKITASASPRCVYQSWGVSLSLKLVVVRTTSWREGVLLGRPRVLPDRSRVYARIDALHAFLHIRHHGFPWTVSLLKLFLWRRILGIYSRFYLAIMSETTALKLAVGRFHFHRRIMQPYLASYSLPDFGISCKWLRSSDPFERNDRCFSDSCGGSDLTDYGNLFLLASPSSLVTRFLRILTSQF